MRRHDPSQNASNPIDSARLVVLVRIAIGMIRSCCFCCCHHCHHYYYYAAVVTTIVVPNHSYPPINVLVGLPMSICVETVPMFGSNKIDNSNRDDLVP